MGLRAPCVPADAAPMSASALVLSTVIALPTAAVDAVDGVRGARPPELVPAGTVIELADDGRLRLAYFASCVHETIRGGRIVVGVLGSVVHGGEVSRVVVPCEVPAVPAGGTPGALILRGAAAPR